MRIKNISQVCRIAVMLVLAALPLWNGHAQGTMFSYQGELMNNGQPATGNYDITFTLFGYNQYGFPVGPVLTNLNVPVSGGVFSTILDFGTVFTGSNYWLELAVRTNGGGEFTILQPRQAITPVPYAVFSANASNSFNALTANAAGTASSVPADGIIGPIPIGNLPASVPLLTTSGTLPTSVLPTNVPLLMANGTLPTNVLPTNLASLSRMAWQSPPGTVVQAQPNIGYLLTNPLSVTITLPASPNIGDVVEIVGAGNGGWILKQNPNQVMAASFVTLTGAMSQAPTAAWDSIASSADGTKLAATVYGGGIWTSSNSGTNWNQTIAPSGGWASIASSSDGTELAVVNNGDGGGGGIWTNAGGSWGESSAPSSALWTAIASSSDGTKLAAAPDFGIWTSTNSGANWVENSGPDASSVAIASSSDGTKLVAAVGYGIWTNLGTNWGQTSAPNENWRWVASSYDGTKLVAVVTGGGIWTSTNSGANWGQTAAPSGSWVSVASSADGTRLAAVIGGGGLWTSVNSGINWGQTGAPSTNWISIASSSDGTKLAAAVDGGGVWIFINGVSTVGSTTAGTGGFIEGSHGTTIELVYAGGGQFVALYQNGALFGY